MCVGRAPAKFSSQILKISTETKLERLKQRTPKEIITSLIDRSRDKEALLNRKKREREIEKEVKTETINETQTKEEEKKIKTGNRLIFS